MAMLIPRPPPGAAGCTEYEIRARERRSFHTVLDASLLLDRLGRRSVARIDITADEVVLALDHPLARGRIREEVRLAIAADGLRTRAFRREALSGSERLMRREDVPELHTELLPLPDGTYPEVALPFLAGWLPLARQRVSLFAWINDRFVARMYLEAAGTKRLGERKALEVVMYPDLNDWVQLGPVLTRLARPFLPKYRMAYELAPPHRLLRFEGPYGPPGAPEVVLEFARHFAIAGDESAAASARV